MTTLLTSNPSLWGNSSNKKEPFNIDDIINNQQGFDSILLSGTTKGVKAFIQKLGLQKVVNTMGTPAQSIVNGILEEVDKDTTTRLTLKTPLNPTIETFKLSHTGRLHSFMTIESHTPKSMELDTKMKKPRGTYSIISFHGLHQPTVKMDTEAIKHLNEFLNWGRFKIHSYDMATDVKESTPINKERKEELKSTLKAYSERGKPSYKNNHSSFYINDLKQDNQESNVSRVLNYEKDTKHGLGKLGWQRVEVSISLKDKRPSFKEYIDSPMFINDLLEVNEIVGLINDKGFNYDYLEYQLNSFIDKRVMNNKESHKRFNSVEALERFKNSDFRRYMLPI